MTAVVITFIVLGLLVVLIVLWLLVVTVRVMNLEEEIKERDNTVDRRLDGFGERVSKAMERASSANERSKEVRKDVSSLRTVVLPSRKVRQPRGAPKSSFERIAQAGGPLDEPEDK